jgi:hydrogenase maturation protease
VTNRIAVIGLGNILLRDEGVGVHTAQILRRAYTFSPDIDIIDGGTAGLDLLLLLEGRHKVILIDAADFGREAGYTRMIDDVQVPMDLGSKLSAHHVGLADALFAARLTDMKLPGICLAGVQPESLELGLELTCVVQGALPAIIHGIIARLAEWGVASTFFHEARKPGYGI